MEASNRVSTVDIIINETKCAAIISPENRYSFISTDFWKNLNLRPVMRSSNNQGNDILGTTTVYFRLDIQDKEVKEEVFVTLAAKYPLVLGFEVLQKLHVSLTFIDGRMKLQKSREAEEENLKKTTSMTNSGRSQMFQQQKKESGSNFTRMNLDSNRGRFAQRDVRRFAGRTEPKSRPRSDRSHNQSLHRRGQMNDFKEGRYSQRNVGNPNHYKPSTKTKSQTSTKTLFRNGSQTSRKISNQDKSQTSTRKEIAIENQHKLPILNGSQTSTKISNQDKSQTSIRKEIVIENQHQLPGKRLDPPCYINLPGFIEKVPKHVGN